MSTRCPMRWPITFSCNALGYLMPITKSILYITNFCRLSLQLLSIECVSKVIEEVKVD